jgi:hypothetical protein
MQIKETILRLFILLLSYPAIAQTTYLAEGDKANILLERLEIKLQKDSVFNFSKIKPFNRRFITARVARLDTSNGFSNVDRYNIHSLMLNNIEWASGNRKDFESKKSIGKNFYKTPANLFEVHTKDFFLVINPVIQYVLSKESNNSQHLFLNTRGVTIRGRIADKIGFAAYLTDNQERDPLYVQAFERKFKAVPGEGFYKPFKSTGYDYFDARGYFTFGVTKFIDVTFGYDKNFIGNGYRSLFLSDFSTGTLFLRLNTRIWKLNYQNLFMELNSSDIQIGDTLLPKKYAALHHLDLAITKWLNIGVFEGIIFGRKDHFEFGYLNPVIFYRSVEQQNGSFDNSVAGLDAKANVAKKFQFYGQLLLDEFLLSEIKRNRGSSANKFGEQIGAKYIDAFNIRNLDLQVELNRVRPFTYSHGDSVANYTHYNQPLAHPLGANFKEVIGIARYQPAPKWLAQIKLIHYNQGVDSTAESFGSNILLPNIFPFRRREFGYDIGSGQLAKATLASFLVSYELRENLFLEVSALFRKYDLTTPPVSTQNSTIISAGVRWNMHRREFNF